ncbi:MAG TPA: hypothetical protein VFR35_00205 [Actinoplanes sp.]|nr:hypothetical protein [Actinoplanes sp.]
MLTLVAALALLTGIGIAGTATASATTAATATPVGVQACSTWQYKVTQKIGVYRLSYDEFGRPHWFFRFYAYAGYYVNTQDPCTLVSGRMYGHVYDTGKDFVGNGWITKSTLDYITCW